MSILSKDMTTTVIPGNPGVPAVQGSPGHPAYCQTSTHTVEVYYSQDVSTWTTIPNSNPNAMGQGYNANSLVINQGSMTLVRYETVTIDTCYPAEPSIPSSPGIPPTPSQLITSMNLGWNSSARSVNPLALDGCLVYRLSQGIHGALYGVGVAGLDGEQPSVFPHAILVDQSGIHAMEHGSITHTFYNTQIPNAELRIYRGADNTIHYVVARGNSPEIKVHKSLIPASVSPSVTVYVYGHLYSSGDKGMTAEFRAGAVVYGRVSR